MKKVSLITDGSCLGNPGPGGWACLLRFELMAPIQGLLALKEPCAVEITTDSEYVLCGITKGIIKWKRRHWWRKHGPVPNADLWMELDELASLHQTTWVWTRGHAGHEDNTRCDWLAQNAAATQRSSWEDGRSHAPLRLDLGADYVPPKPQGRLFEDEEAPGEDDEDDEEAVRNAG